MKYLFHLTVEEFANLITQIIDEKLNRFKDDAFKRNKTDELTSRKEAAKFLAVSTVTLDRYRRLGYIEAEPTIGKPVRFFKSKLLFDKKIQRKRDK